MRIKRLEIFGFKSFPKKVNIVFPSGISAIVGPNGCGKSNLVDALRWILGEQNPRFLRVREMTDLIYAGENGHRPDFAEVKLILDNDKKEGPKDLAQLNEISVARRLYRDGESEFYLNNRPCRLKDIVYLFLDTGVHARGYGIIDQGRVSQFLELSPKERRRFLEELAGIARFKVKKEETERQLSRTKENLNRIKDILTEVESRLTELKEQAKKAEEYLKLQEEIRDLSLKKFDYLFRQARDKQQEVSEKIASLKEEVKNISLQINQLEPQKDEKEALILLLKQEIEKIKADFNEVDKKLKNKEKVFHELLKEESNIGQKTVRIKEKIAGKKERIEAIKKRILEIKSEKELVNEKIVNSQDELKNLHRDRQELFKEKDALEKNIKNIKESLFKIKYEIDEKRKLKQKNNQILETKLKELQKIDQEIKTLEERYKKSLEKQKELEIKKENLDKRQKELSKKIENLELKIEEKKIILEREREKISDLRLKIKEVTSEIEWLKQIIKDRKSEAEKLLKNKGFDVLSVFETIELAPEEEKIAELAFPELLEAIYFKDKETCQKAISVLKKEKIQALIVYNKNPSLLIKAKIKNISLKDEIDLTEKQAVVTLQGELWDPDGIFRLKGKVSSLLTHKKMLDEKIKFLPKTKEELLEKEKNFKEINKILENLKREYTENIKFKKQLNNELQSIESSLKKIALDTEKAIQRKELLEKQKQQINKEIVSLKEVISQIELDNLLKEKDNLESELHKLEEQFKLKNKQLKAVLAKIRAIELEITANKEKFNQLIKEEKRILQEETNLARDIEKLHEEKFIYEEKLNDLKKEIANIKKDIDSLLEKREQLQNEINAKQKDYQQIDEFLKELTKSLEVLKNEKQQKEKKLHRLEIDLAEIELTLSHLREQAKEQFNIDLPLEQNTSDLSLAQIEKILKEKKEEFNSFGPVNLQAIEELQKTEERRAFLLEQKADLEKAIDDLISAVKQIDRTCREKLKEALKAANLKLAEIFPLLFEGGQAELQFTENDDPLEAGLDLVIKLPGKPIRHLSMLSGGEKALTALAVLCAFYLVKPGPFCILDEVDAPLDEANTEKFIRLLQELSKYSQIILVTHNKRVMEHADLLIGVTMEEKGISKIVSVSLS
ncbi:AAA family ATPase [Thermodesulfatator indicus]